MAFLSVLTTVRSARGIASSSLAFVLRFFGAGFESCGSSSSLGSTAAAGGGGGASAAFLFAVVFVVASVLVSTSESSSTFGAAAFLVALAAGLGRSTMTFSSTLGTTSDALFREDWRGGMAVDTLSTQIWCGAGLHVGVVASLWFQLSVSRRVLMRRSRGRFETEPMVLLARKSGTRQFQASGDGIDAISGLDAGVAARQGAFLHPLQRRDIT